MEINFKAAWAPVPARETGSSGRFCREYMRHSDKSSLDKPHLSICDEAAAVVLSEPPSIPYPYAFPHDAGGRR